MTTNLEQQQKALEAFTEWWGTQLDDSPTYQATFEAGYCAALAAGQQALEQTQGEVVSVDWQDMYWKQKRRAEMWIAKYEKDIGPLEKVHPQATEPATNPILSSEALRQLDEVMPFRINLVKSGQMASLSVLHECINNVAEEFDLPDHMKPMCIREPAPSTTGEADEYQYRTKPTWDANAPWSDWTKCNRGSFEDYKRTPVHNDWIYETRALFAATPPQVEPAPSTAGERTGNVDIDAALIMLDRMDVSADDDARVDSISATLRKAAALLQSPADHTELVKRLQGMKSFALIKDDLEILQAAIDALEGKV